MRGGPATPDPARPVMLFLHGFPEAWFSWSRQLQEFQKTYDVVAFDMRGYNESDKPAVWWRGVWEPWDRASGSEACVLWCR